MVIIDPLGAVSDVSLTAVRTVRKFIMRPLQGIARTYGLAMVVAHHLTKDGQVAGSAAVVDAARSVLMIKRDVTPISGS